MKRQIATVVVVLLLLTVLVVYALLSSNHLSSTQKAPSPVPVIKRQDAENPKNPATQQRKSDAEIAAELESVHISEGEIAIVPVDLLINRNACRLVIAVGSKSAESSRVAAEKAWRSVHRIVNNNVVLTSESGSTIEFAMYPIPGDEAGGAGKDEKTTIYPPPPPVRRIQSSGEDSWSIVEPEVYSKSPMEAGLYKVRLSLLSSTLPGPQLPNVRISFLDRPPIAAKRDSHSR